MITTKPFNPADFIKTDADVAHYINDAMMDDDPNVLMLALSDIAKIRGGMANIAKDAGLNRESLYKTLSGKTQPKWQTVHKIITALGIDLIANPAHH